MRLASLGRYEIVRKLGEGAMGAVYMARDPELDRFVAIKTLQPHYLGSKEAAQRFEQEARAISALDHPHVAVIHELGREGGVLFLVLEYLPGGTLRSRILEMREAGRFLPLQQIRSWALQSADGLAHAHRRRIVHRDVKSANLMFTAEDGLKVTDFGLAKRPGTLDLTKPGTIVGTISYMSPEQAQGLELDHRTDIFSLGIVLFEMAAGELPFRGTHEGLVLDHIVHSPTPELRALRPDLPAAFDLIVQRATAKRPDDRYQTMADLAADLRVLTADRSDSAADRPTLTVHARPPAPRRPNAVLSAAAVLIAALLAITSFPYARDWLARERLPDQKRLVVLPFNNVGNDPANQPFCDGLIETLSAKFTQLEQLQQWLNVVPPSEVRRAGIASAADARRAFRVNLALTGSVQRFGNTVRLTMALVNAESLRQLQSEVRDIPLGDVSVLQDGVFSRAAAMLALELHPGVRNALNAGQTHAPGAYYSYVQALGYLSRYDVVENIDRAIPLFERAIEEDPDYALAHAHLGEAYWRKFQSAKDRQWADRAIASCLRAVQLDGRLANAHVTLGLLHRETGRLEESERELRTALEINPASADAYRQLARSLEMSGKIADAEAAHQNSIRLRPDYWLGYWELAEFYYRRARYDQAAAEYRKVIQLAPDHARAYASLGGIYYLQGRFPDAEVMFSKSLAVKPTPEAYSNFGALYSLQGRYSEAVPMFENAIALGTTQHQIWGNLAEAYRETPHLKGKAPEAYAHAIESARKQLAVNPKEARVRASLGYYLARIGDSRRALSEIEEARRLAPSNQNILFRSALVYEFAGRREQALQALATAAANGYSLAEIRGAKDLQELRKDPRYKQLVEEQRPEAAPGRRP